MHHKRKRPKHQRAGCTMCKPWKDDQGTKKSDRLKASERRKLQKDDE